jgi:hypothetical protein
MAAIKQEVNTPLILTVGVVSALLLLVIVFGLEAWFVREETAEITQKWEMSRNEWLDNIRDPQRATVEKTIGPATQLIIRSNGKLPATQPAKK